MTKIFTLVLATALSLNIYAQSDVDALRYSMQDFGGTARSLGSGNAYGALGGDMSSLSMNPAGIGIYRSSEFVITPGLLSINSESDYLGQTNSDNRYSFNINNFGFVFNHLNTGKENATDGWVSGSFGIAYNKLANYNNSVLYSGFNEQSSLIDSYVEYLNAGGGTDPSNVFDKDPFGAGLAWETYLINPTGFDSMQYYSVIHDGDVQQTKSIITKGGLNEVAISFGGNYGNRLYVGATIGIPNIRYSNSTIYSEEDINDEHSDFNEFTLNDYSETYGVGINAKLGLIYRINEYIRLGAAVHSPSLFGLTDNYYSSMNSSLDTSGSFSFDSPLGEYSYELITPWRVIGSAAITIKEIGLISAEYEFVDYSEAGFNFNRSLDAGDLSYENTVNNNIDLKYGAASVIRLGGELKYDVFRFRAGYIMSGTPFNDGIAANDADFAKNTYTAGIGIKEKSYFIDLAFAHTTSKEYDIQYIYDDGTGVNDGATINSSLNNFLLSFGFRF
ncbi:MAG: OmpP1/FadL family transporter [Chitinophagales bacterium]